MSFALKRGGDPTRTLVDALIGMEATVIKDFVEGQGQVKLAVGETWTARVSAGQEPELEIGDRVVVTAIEGATAFVAPVERTAQ